MVPYFSGKIVDEFLTEDAAVKIVQYKDHFYHLIMMMILLTILRVGIAYLDCIAVHIYHKRRTDNGRIYVANAGYSMRQPTG